MARLSTKSGGERPQVLLDHFNTREDFQLMLETAKDKVKGDREDDFVHGLQDKLDKFGTAMYLSEGQVRWLCDIAARS